MAGQSVSGRQTAATANSCKWLLKQRILRTIKGRQMCERQHVILRSLHAPMGFQGERVRRVINNERIPGCDARNFHLDPVRLLCTARPPQCRATRLLIKLAT